MLALSIFSLSAQTKTKETEVIIPKKESKSLFGFRVGLAHNSLSPELFNSLYAYTSKATILNLTLVSEFPVSKYVSLMPEIAYNQKGANFTYGSSSSRNVMIGDFTFATVGANLIPKVHYDYKDFEFYGLLGAGASVNISSKVSSTDALSKEEYDIDSLTNFLNFDIIVGGGLGYKVNTGKFFFDMRYNVGMNLYGNGKYNLYYRYYIGELPSNGKLNQFSMNLGYLHKF